MLFEECECGRVETDFHVVQFEISFFFNIKSTHVIMLKHSYQKFVKHC